MGKIDIHSIWKFSDKVNKNTGEIEERGLFPILGIESTAREFKKRCDLEVEHAGKPLAACAYYTQLIMHWVTMCISGEDAADPGSRKLTERHLLGAGEKEIVDLIEDMWKPYKGYDELPVDIQHDARDEAREILENRYGDIAYMPDHLSPTEIALSKEIALLLGVKKPRVRRTPAPEEAPLEESSPEPEEELVESEEKPAPTSADADTADAIEEAVRNAIE